MRELILGGEGLIGSELAGLLRSKGHLVESLDLVSGCDLRFAGKESFDNCDRVWFLAWDTGGAKYLQAQNKQHEIFKHNAELCARVFELLEKSRKPFLFTTSQLAGLDNGYGSTKLLGEKWALALGGKLARLWNVYGWEKPSVRSHVITDFVLSGLTRGKITCHTNGQERRRFLYKSDCASGLVQLFDSETKAADFAGEQWYRVAELAQLIGQRLGVPVELGHENGIEVMVEPGGWLEGWRPVVSLEDGLNRVVHCAKSYVAATHHRTTDAQEMHEQTGAARFAEHAPRASSPQRHAPIAGE